MRGYRSFLMSKDRLSTLDKPSCLISGIVAGMMLIAGPALSCGIETPQDYHEARYAALHCGLVDAVAIDAPDLKALIKIGIGPVLIDIEPVKRTAEADISGYWIVNEAHENIAGSIWLPNVGEGTLDETMTAYFQTQLDQATAGDRHRFLVFYGSNDMVMALNAAQRAIDLGYERVAWLFQGAEGWRQAGEPTALAVPEPLFRKTTIDQATIRH